MEEDDEIGGLDGIDVESNLDGTLKSAPVRQLKQELI